MIGVVGFSHGRSSPYRATGAVYVRESPGSYDERPVRNPEEGSVPYRVGQEKEEEPPSVEPSDRPKPSPGTWKSTTETGPPPVGSTAPHDRASSSVTPALSVT